MLSLVAIYFEFRILQHFQFVHYYLFLLLFVQNFSITDFVSVFIDLVDL